MNQKKEIGLLLNDISKDEELIMLKTVSILYKNRNIGNDFNIVSLIEDLKNMNLKQCEILHLLKTKLENCLIVSDIERKNITKDMELLIINNTIENINCGILNDLSINQKVSNSDPIIVNIIKRNIIKYYSLNSKNIDEMELDLILTSKKNVIDFNKNYKKLIKRKE
ncbi:MAG: hypothetical protein IJF92_04975 [Bacilli bacterium]|nr:hypothetical protein [Bacilli bacterium]